MSLQVIGAGLGRTGTSSLQIALEHLLSKPCYHMRVLLENPEDTPTWHNAAFGKMPFWNEFLADYGAAVDWPASAFWPELMAAFPQALVILSVREAEAWCESASRTIYAPHEPKSALWHEMIAQIDKTRFPIQEIIHSDRDAACELFNAWNERVKSHVPPKRLLVWQAKDGWEPLCNALRLPVPDMPFPHANTRADWVARLRAAKVKFTV